MGSNDHIINRQIVEAVFSSRGDAIQAREEISAIYHNHLLPLINEIFNDISNGDEHIRIDRLEIDLGKTSSGKLREDLMEKLRKQLPDELLRTAQQQRKWPHNGIETQSASVRRRKQNTFTISSHQSNLELFVHFVKTGQLPWWAGKSNGNRFKKLAHKLIEEQPMALGKALRELIAYTNYINRITHQLPDETLVKLIHLIQPEMADPVYRLQQDLCSLHQHRELLPMNRTSFRLVVWQYSFQFCMRTPAPLLKTPGNGETSHPFPAAIQEYMRFLFKKLSGHAQSDVAAKDRAVHFAKRVMMNTSDLSRKRRTFRTRSLKKMSASAFKRLSKEEVEERDPARAGDTNTIHSPTLHEKQSTGTSGLNEEDNVEIHNAGLVLLWPFLPAFFEGIGLVDNKTFVTEDAAKRAALLLEYAVTKETEMPEYDLMLNKLLCGINVDEPLPSVLELSTAEKDEIECLLTAAAGRWEALKGTSGEGLRRTFLIKDGILTKGMNGWKLMVERSAVDVLLNKLPWSISVIKLPWSRQILYIEW